MISWPSPMIHASQTILLIILDVPVTKNYVRLASRGYQQVSTTLASDHPH